MFRSVLLEALYGLVRSVWDAVGTGRRSGESNVAWTSLEPSRKCKERVGVPVGVPTICLPCAEAFAGAEFIEI